MNTTTINVTIPANIKISLVPVVVPVTKVEKNAMIAEVSRAVNAWHYNNG